MCTFMLDHGNNTKEAKRVISELYQEDVNTERTCERWFAKFREGDRSLKDLPRTGRRKSSIVNSQNSKLFVCCYYQCTS